MNTDLAGAMEHVALALLGDPNKSLSRGKELRWGKQGSMEVLLDKGVWHDHESDTKGGTLALIKHMKGLEPKEAFDWMRSTLGIEIDGAPVRTPTNGSARPTPRPNGKGEPPSQRPVPSVSAAATKGQREIVKTFDFCDVDGGLLYQEVRAQFRLADGSWELGTKGKPRKAITQRRPDPERRGEWIWNLEGVAHGLYNFPTIREEMLQEPDERRTIYLPEGPGKCDLLAEWGLLATCNSGGAGHWLPAHAEELHGADVVILIDNDDPGRKRGEAIAASLAEVKAKVRILDFKKFWPECPDKGDVVDWRDQAKGTKEKLFEIVDKLPLWSPGEFKSKFGAIQWSELQNKREPYEWLIRGIIPARERIMMFGPPESGKSFAATEMCLAIARGIDYAGQKTERRGVIYCAFEGGKGFATRVEGYRQHHELQTTDGTPFLMLTRGVDLFGDEEVIKSLEEEIEHWAPLLSAPLGVIAFDTVSASAGSMDENHGADVAKYLMMIRRIAARFGVTVILIHHKPKAAANSPRGSGKWTGDLETTIEVDYETSGAEDENGRPIRIVRLRKQREGEGQREIKRFVLRQIEVGVDPDGQPVKTCVVLPPGGVATVTKKTGFSPSPQEEKVLRAFLSALKEHGAPPPLTAEIPAGTTAVITYRQWRDEFAEMDFNPEEDTAKANNRIKTAMARAGYAFTEKFSMKVLGRLRRGGSDDLFWLTGVAVRGFPETFGKPKLVETAAVAAGDDWAGVPDEF